MLTQVDSRPGVISRNKVFYILLCIIYKILLDFTYANFVSKNFEYAGFTFSLNYEKYVISSFLLFIYSICLPSTSKCSSSFFLNIMYLCFFIPLASFYALADKDTFSYLTLNLSFIIIYLISMINIIKLPTINLNKVNFVENSLWAFCITITAYYILSGGLKNLNFNLLNVYDFREEASEITSQGIMGYLSNWAWKVIGIALLCSALEKDNKIRIIAILILYIFWFALSAHKSVLFYPICIIGLWWYFKKNNSNNNILIISLIVIIVLSYFTYLYSQNMLLPSLFIRRVFFVVANNSFDYFEYFYDRERIYWSNSFVTLGLIDYPFDMSPADLIGSWRGTDSHVNNSFFSTGFIHAGLSGTILYSIAVGVILKIVDSIQARGDYLFMPIGVLFVPMWSLIMSADLITALATHGIGLAILILFIFRK